MPLVSTMLPDETPLEMLRRYMEKFGMGQEVEDSYDVAIRAGDTPRQAAHYALNEWDLLDYREEV